MLYRDLVQFTPIETVIQLRDADREAEAKNLVETYVISEPMANKLVDVAFPQLRLDQPQDTKGILIVGNYGTGKSHLMSVVSAVAERAELRGSLTNARVSAAAEPFAGKFKVVRVEIGGVTRPLRDMLLDEVQSALESWGVAFVFPAADQVNENKTALIQAVAAFQEKYPQMGLLLVVDELLDYLRSREERQLILDLSFLRELGEVGSSCAFRFIGGLQETLFENPRFSFAADQLRRVKDRFEQITIAREDIAFVVSERLLKKTDRHKAWIADHLRNFSPLYTSMAERMEEFVDLFPIHPAYVETFQTLAIAEKREVLKTFSAAIRSVLDQPVPEDQPGLISYDHYWQIIQADASLRSLSEIAQVIEKSNVLEQLIRANYTRPALKDMALRIIHALSVQRLATGDIFLPVGATAEALRDGLCLYAPLPEASRTADFLGDQVQVALREIMTTVQGQFISYNEQNGQYYLDLKKAVDFDQKIQNRGDFMDRSDLNRYFYDALRQALNLSDSTYLTGHRIWFYELPWEEHKVTRPGYLFFGLPDERTTAQPPRDFYLYFLPPFPGRAWEDPKLADEVFFQLSGTDADFEKMLRLYAGARAMANEASEYRSEYGAKAEVALRRMIDWLRAHLLEKLHVIYQGADDPVGAVLPRLRSTHLQSLEATVRSIAASLLAPQFEERYPDYPRFRRLTDPVSEASRANSAMEAVRYLTGRQSNLGFAILDGLGLVDEHRAIRPANSAYARAFLELLRNKSEGQVVNRGEVIEIVSGGVDQPVEKDRTFKLEAEWVAVVLLALVYSGDIVLNLDGREEIDAAGLDRAAALTMPKLTGFRFYQRPRGIPVELWKLVFEQLGLQPGLIVDQNTREEAVKELQTRVNAELERAVRLEKDLEAKPTLWNTPLFTDDPTYVVEEGVVTGSNAPRDALSKLDLLPGVRGWKQFLERLTTYNTVGKLNRLSLSLEQIQEAGKDRQGMDRAEHFLDCVRQLQPAASYLAEAEANLPASEAWVQRARKAREQILDALQRLGKGEAEFDAQAASRQLEDLKEEYISLYSELHRRHVLNAEADERRQKLYQDPRFRSLNELAKIDLLAQGRDLERWKQQLSGLPSCPEFHEGLLAASPTCPSCHYRPVERAGQADAQITLVQLEEQLSSMLLNWRKALHAALESPTAQRSRQAMAADERQPIDAFLAQPDEEENLPEGLVPAAQRALHGIEALTLEVDALLQALKAGGLPCTPQELRGRFQQFLDDQMSGRNAESIRLTLDR